MKSVLDLGGFVGDSAILLSKKNKLIFTFEPEKEKFKQMIKNIKLNSLQSRIFSFNFAVVSAEEKQIKLNTDGLFSPGSSLENRSFLQNSEIVKCIHIKDVLKIKDFEGIKCDIEGGEFGIVDYFLKNPKIFRFKKGIFEWHFSKKDSQINTLKNFLNFLNSNGYRYFFYSQNNPKKKFTVKNVLSNLYLKKYGEVYALMFYFEKLEKIV